MRDGSPVVARRHPLGWTDRLAVGGSTATPRFEGTGRVWLRTRVPPDG